MHLLAVFQPLQILLIFDAASDFANGAALIQAQGGQEKVILPFSNEGRYLRTNKDGRCRPSYGDVRIGCMSYTKIQGREKVFPNYGGNADIALFISQFHPYFLGRHFIVRIDYCGHMKLEWNNRVKLDNPTRVSVNFTTEVDYFTTACCTGVFYSSLI